jgi:hypothetical protein
VGRRLFRLDNLSYFGKLMKDKGARRRAMSLVLALPFNHDLGMVGLFVGFATNLRRERQPEGIAKVRRPASNKTSASLFSGNAGRFFAA